MTKETRLALLEQALRHSNQLLVEAVGNHAGLVSAESRSKLTAAANVLAEAIDRVRQEVLS